MLNFYSDTFSRLSLTDLKDVGQTGVTLISSILNYRVAILLHEGENKEPELLAIKGLSQDFISAWNAEEDFVRHLWREIDSPTIVTRDDLETKISSSAKKLGIEEIFLTVPFKSSIDNKEKRIGLAIAASPPEGSELDIDIIALDIITGLISGAITTCKVRVDLIEVNKHLESDITKRKHAEEALRESEHRLARSQEISHLGSWELDLVSKKLTWSDEVYRIFGLQPEEFGATYEAFLEAVHPDDRAEVDTAYSVSLREGRDTYEIEHRIVRKSDGEIRIVHEKCEHIRDSSGQIIRSVGMVQDITERKRVEEALRDSEGRYRLLFNGITDAVYVHEVSVEKPGKFFAVNDSACRMLGYTRDEFLQMEVKDIDVPEQAEKLPFVHKKLFKDGYALFEGCHVAKDGRRIPVEINIQLFELHGKSMVLAVARDITERRQAEEELKRAEQLKVAGELVTGLAHELKNSLAGLKVSTEVLLDELVLSEDNRDVLSKMIGELQRIEFLMRDVLYFARPRELQFDLLNINIMLDTAITFSLKSDRVLLRNETIKVIKEFDENLPRTMADLMQLQQVFMNLLINAVESLQEGGVITVKTHYEPSDNSIHISIADTGKGINNELKEKIFELFFTTKPKGTGLGLPITKRLIEQHGGNIRVETSLGKGTTFNVALPVKQF
jgi:PAS domain S-box-containing protein